VAGKAKSWSLRGKLEQMFRSAAWVPDPGKSAAGIAAVEILFDDLVDDRLKIIVN